MMMSPGKEAKQTIQLALPIIFGELAQMALHLIDTAMIGSISHIQLAAAALVINVMNIPFVLGIGITMSISQTVSMYQGQQDSQKVSHYLFNGFWICVVTALLISGGLVFGRDILFHLHQDPEVARLAAPFLRIMGFSLIPMILFMALKQFTDGLQHTRTAMLLSVLALPLNAFINWLLIYGNWGFPRMEMMGAAYGTLITRSIIFVALGIIILRHRLFRRYIAVRKNQWHFSYSTISDLLRIGVPSGLQIGMEAGAFAVSGILIGTIGAVEQAAHQIALSCAAFTFMASMGLAQAGSIRVSNAYGAADGPKIRIIGKSTMVTALVYGIFCAGIFILLRHQLPLAFNHKKEVISMASLLLIFAAIFQISDATQAIGAGLLRGIKDIKIPTLLIGISYWALGIPVGYLLAFRFNMGAPGIWLGFITGLTFASLFLSARFLRMAGRTQQQVSALKQD